MQENSCESCRYYLDCAYRLLIEGHMPCAGEGFEPYT